MSRNLPPPALLPILALVFVLHAPAHAQTTWDIKDPGVQMQQKCGECLAALSTRPKEVQFGLYADGERNVWFVLTDARFYDQLIKKAGDGFAVDVIRRSQYVCGHEPPPQDRFHKGTLLKPVYKADLERTRKTGNNGALLMKVGTLPPELADQPYEMNLLILKDHHLCYYNWFYDITAYRWDLLNMGMFMDSLTYGQQFDTTRNARVSGILRRKDLHFTIPFEKNKSEYSARDLQPLYDSLRLTNFTIKRIEIEAYSSVEGPEERNIELQEKRAQSIVNALQSFQQPSIVTTVKASENWVEFLNDVLLTSQASLADLPKAEIKERLRDKRTADQLEPILAHHRKAQVTLELQRKDGLHSLKEEEIVREFEKAIGDKNLDRARELQNTVFERIMDDELPQDFINKLEVPVQRDFAQLLNSRAAFKYFEDPTDAFTAYQALEELARLLPNDGHVKYNLCAVKFRLWLLGGQTVDPAQFKKEIEALRLNGIPDPLVKRMLIDHHIITAEINMAKGDYVKKDEDIKFISRNYGSIPMIDQDRLSLAQYFASFANFDEALKVVKPYVTGIEADQDLLFYFLNLTIFDEKITAQNDYRRIMLNAINKDKPRFCKMFEPFGKGGITFQLLDNPYLMKTYCETCD